MLRNLILFFLTLIIAVGAMGQDLSKMYEKLKPTVVVIRTQETLPGTSMPGAMSMQGLGSGVVISEDGLIMTASHVVNTADKIEVVFAWGEKVPAKVEGVSQIADVALVRLVWVPKKIVAAKLGNSDKLKVGNEIFIIGAPFGLEYSFTVGFVSGKHSTNRSSGLQSMEFIQTDASINTGNSGGPMFNMEGEVVGIVSSILSKSGGFEGVGFAATSNIARRLLLDQSHPWTGIETFELSGALARIFNVPQERALLVEKVVYLSPGGMLGLEPSEYEMEIEGHKIKVGGDIILSINGFNLANDEDLKKLDNNLRMLGKGDMLKATVLRGGKVIELETKMP